MGRLSRHRKIKSCDPFFKGPRTDRAARNSDRKLSVEKDDIDKQKIPRGMRIIMAQANPISKKKRKKKKIKTDLKKSSNVKAKFQRNPGEGNKEYFNRIDHEAAMAVAECMKGNKQLSERRKKHLKERREKAKQKKLSHSTVNALDFTDLKDETRFGEVAEQPPALTAKPRKAPVQSKGNKSLLLSSLLAKANQESNIDQTECKRKDSKSAEVPKSKRRKHMTAVEKAALDKERERVILAYRMAKKNKVS